MNINQLIELLGFLQAIRNFESLADMMMQDECDKLIKMIREEIYNKHIMETR